MGKMKTQTDGLTTKFRWNAKDGDWCGEKNCFEMTAEEQDVGDLLRVSYCLRLKDGSASLWYHDKNGERKLYGTGNYTYYEEGSYNDSWQITCAEEIVEIKEAGELRIALSMMMFIGNIDGTVERIPREQWNAMENSCESMVKDPLMTPELESALLKEGERVRRGEGGYSWSGDLKVLAMYYDPLNPTWQWYIFYGRKLYDNDMQIYGLEHGMVWRWEDWIMLRRLENAWPESKVCRRKLMPGVCGRRLEDVLKEHGAPGWEEFLYRGEEGRRKYETGESVKWT